MDKKLNMKIVFGYLAAIIISFIAGLYAMLWYNDYSEKKGLIDFLGGKENYKKLRTITYKFEKVYTLSNGEELKLTGDDIKYIENN